MEYIASGAQADIYRDGTKAIKIFKNIINKKDVENEFNLQKIAFSYNLPVPEIFDIIEIDNKFGMVMEYIEGVPIGNIMLKDNTRFEEYLVKSIDIQNSIHKIETDKLPLMKNIQKDYILGTDKLTGTDKERIKNNMDNKIYDNKLCHGDFHVLNLIQTSNDIKIIDWVCASSGNPCADICRTFLLYKIYMEEMAEIYLETYCKIKEIDKSEILSWLPIITAARLGEYVKDEKEEYIYKRILRDSL